MRSLRIRLLLAYAGLILAGFTLLSLLVGRQISAGTMQDYATSLGEQAQLVARALVEPVEEAIEGEVSLGTLRTLLQTYADQTGAEVFLWDRNGRFLTSSSGSSTVGNTPEIAAARSGRVGSDVRGATAFAAAPVQEDERIIGVVQLAAPLTAAQGLVVQRWLQLAGAVLVVTAVAGIAGYWLAATLTRPLAQLRQAAMQIATGDFSRRLPQTRRDEIGTVARAFNHMATEVEAMIEEQRAFASNASHELRTPLTTVRLRSEALRAGTVDEATARQYIIEIDEEVQRLSGLVQDLLLLSRLETGRLQTGKEQIDLMRLAKQLQSEFEEEATRRHITFDLDTPPSLPTIRGAHTHLLIAFRNLLNNALKYSQDGGKITWRIRQDAADIVHTIQDTGQGIDPADLPHLFDRFYRADKSRSRAVSGAGLGLSLVQMIVTLYGGTIYIESDGINEGTMVYVRWPNPQQQDA